MFNSMKNQFREKTGKELPKFNPQKGALSRQSRQGSESSLSSLVLEPSSNSSQSPATLPVQTQELIQLKLPDGKIPSPKELNLLAKKEEEWRLKLEKRESDLLQEWSKKEEDWKLKEKSLTEELLRQTNELRDALRIAEDYKKKIFQYQEDKDQLEGFQTQEMAKIKHLLLAKEKESSETAAALKESLQLVDNLKTEVNRLRPLEEKISNYEDDIEMLRHTSEKERWNLSSKLAQSEEEVRHLTDRVAVLTRRVEAGTEVQLDDRMQALLGERALLERRLEEAHVHLTDIKASWSAQISSLETQVGRLSRQAGEEGAERRRAEVRVTELETKLEEEAKERERLIAKTAKLAEEVDNLASELKGANALIEKDKTSLSEMTAKLRGSEESGVATLNKVSRLEQELSTLSSLLVESEKRCSAITSENQQDVQQLKDKLDLTVKELKEWENRFEKLEEENSELERKLDISSVEVLELRASLEDTQGSKTDLECEVEEAHESTLKERKEKEDLLMRNAELSQALDMTRQELEQHHTEVEEVVTKVPLLEVALSDKEQELKKSKDDYARLLAEMSSLQTESETREAAALAEQSLKERIASLEQQVADKNKNIRVLQQKLSDLKKTLQKELKVSDPGGGGESMVSNHNHNTPGFLMAPTSSQDSSTNGDEINFLYLKHVVLRFLTGKEYEIQHLTRAVATLLKLSPEEENLLKDTLDWKMSWFPGSRPRLENYKHS